MAQLPEIGQSVLARGRPWLVEDCQAQSTPGPAPQHLITLASLDDNVPDEKLRVIWELEAGTRIWEASSLPEMAAFDAPGDVTAFINAVRWGTISPLDEKSLQSPFRSGIAAEDYQLEPVARALTMPRVNLLLADDVGLGKTIEAGLTMRELMLRNRANTVLILCPASLQYQWQDEMRDKFGLEFRIINSEAVSLLRRQRGIHVNPWTHFPRLIASIDYFKQDHVFQRFRATLPPDGRVTWPRPWDLLIIDEAHNIAPAGSLHYTRPSLRTRVAREIAPHFEHRIFLTATPHNGYSQSFSALLEILDQQRFVRGLKPSPEALARVMVRRMKSEIRNPDGSARFPERAIRAIAVDYTAEERNAHALFARYMRLCRELYRDGQAGAAFQFILKLLKKRLFSSPRAFARTLERHIARRKSQNAGPKAGPAHLSLPDPDEFTDADEAENTEAALIQCQGALGAPTPEELALLEELRDWARTAEQQQDAKLARLLEWLNATLRPDGAWNNNRVVIFTEYVDSQDYIADWLARAGLGGDRLICINGLDDAKKRESAKAAFQADPAESPVRILLGTDAASEGINLQNHCSRLFHYEIPWNPSRLEQRNGRVDRHGQTAPEVEIFHFVASGFASETGASDALGADLEFLRRVVFKVNNIRLDLGKIGPVIAAQVEKAMLGEAQDRKLDTDAAQREAEAARRSLKIDRDLNRFLKDINERMAASQAELDLSPPHVREAVSAALRLAGQPPLLPVEVAGIPPAAAWQLPELSGAWAECLAGNRHPYTDRPRPVVFDAALAQGRDDVVAAHLNHRLVAMSLRLLRGQLWATGPSACLNRASCEIVPDDLLDAPALVLTGRIVVAGKTNQRIFEEVIECGGRIREQRFSRLGQQEIERLRQNLRGHMLKRAAPEQERLLRERIWPKIRPAAARALAARADERLTTLASRIERRAADEIKRFAAVMDELKKMLQDHLAEMSTATQLALPGFDAEETAAFIGDQTALRARLDRIDGEKEAECAHLAARFENPRPALFPLALQWYIPESGLGEKL